MILAQLKESTRHQHDALESVVDVMNKTFSLEDYKGLLTKFYSFYAAVEPLLPASELLAEGFDIGLRRKLPKLELDLKELGVLAEVKRSPIWSKPPSVESVPEAFGSIYVMEGATLGGQVITRHLKEHLGLTPEKGGAFFNSYGKDVGPMWKEFGAAITAYAERNPETGDSIVESAKQTFDSFRECFESDGAVTAAA
ncbi:MAG: biliverdin-producing heme oxygenase [Pyrinomonadaceae bacterium]